MIYVELFIEFFKIGIFSVGGGLATLPFLNKLVDTKGWYSVSELTNMLAISESTPGPIGVNMATYVGYHTGSIIGAIIATFALVLPSYIIIIIISNFLSKFKNNIYVLDAFNLIRPVVTGLIGVSFITIFNTAIFSGAFDIKKIVIFLAILFIILKYKKHPIFYIGLGAILGFLFKLS
ncbi:chromate transporter [uncultured Tyzzerella sp.]|uniref:chromate transporter n=1 Tax=uncultured Tyzzerella sp. TaxID=2321398 RepID=UPI002942DEEA|nr:chromate transporter [uncultured Tyzzerella sp.]